MKRQYWVMFYLNEQEDPSVIGDGVQAYWPTHVEKGTQIEMRAIVEAHDGGPNVRAILEREWSTLKGVKLVTPVQDMDHLQRILEHVDVTPIQARRLGITTTREPEEFFFTVTKNLEDMDTEDDAAWIVDKEVRVYSRKSLPDPLVTLTIDNSEISEVAVRTFLAEHLGCKDMAEAASVVLL